MPQRCSLVGFNDKPATAKCCSPFLEALDVQNLLPDKQAVQSGSLESTASDPQQRRARDTRKKALAPRAPLQTQIQVGHRQVAWLRGASFTADFLAEIQDLSHPGRRTQGLCFLHECFIGLWRPWGVVVGVRLQVVRLRCMILIYISYRLRRVTGQ
jgi:hypothetical protein